MPTRREVERDRIGWEDFATQTRDCLAHMGFTIVADCMPDESEPCGRSYQQHAQTNLSALRAIVDHQLNHAGGMLGHAYEWATAEVLRDCHARNDTVR